MLTKYELVFTLVTFGTVVIYVGFTFAITEWRMDYRRQMNVLTPAPTPRPSTAC